MKYRYQGYNERRKIVRGRIAASSAEAAVEAIDRGGTRILSLKETAPFMPNWKTLFPSLFKIKPEVIATFSRHLALLLNSGISIIQSLEILRVQCSNSNLKKIIQKVVTDLQAGEQLSTALSKYPESFPKMYSRSLTIGERTGNLESVLVQIAEFMERENKTAKEIKGALRYPTIVSVVAIIVIGVLVTFVLPAFTSFYHQLGIKLPAATLLLLNIIGWLHTNWVYVVGAGLFLGAIVLLYTRTIEGKIWWDRINLKVPILGNVRHTIELAHACRSISMLTKAGLPLPEIVSLVIENAQNRVIKLAFADVREDMLKGEGLSKPMAKNRLFFPMIVQMVKVGEETGNLDVTMASAAQAFETEAEDKMHAFIGFIQPTITLLIGGVVAFIAISLISAMYSMYGQMF